MFPQCRLNEVAIHFMQHALKYYSLVFDAIYTPKITRLLREAQESGATIVTGLEMFIGQAYEQFERFTGLPGKMHATSLLKTQQLHIIFILTRASRPCPIAAPKELFKQSISNLQ